ncbi:MAG: hypothetical protein SO164_02465 [Campylobacter sp.]|nr:hypothetical protein [Campylobacter sp.]
MQGKILSPQLISGDDGKHYEYDKNDVINLDGKDLALLTGSQVEFLSFDKRVAKSIYIIAENLNVSSILSADSISLARLSALLGLGLLFFSLIPRIVIDIFISYIWPIIDIVLQFSNFISYIWPIIPIVSFVLYSMAIYSVNKAAASKSLFKNYIIAVIISFFVIPAILSLLLPGILVGTLIALIVAIYLYKMHAELARLSGSSLFLWAFWIFVVSVPLFFLSFGLAVFLVVLGGFEGSTDFLFVGFGGLIIAWVLLFVAWWRFKKLEKR